MCDSTLFLRLHAKYVRTCKAICFSVWFLVCRQRCALTKAIASSSHMMAHDAGNFAPTRVYGEENPESDNTHHQIPTVEGDPIPLTVRGIRKLTTPVTQSQRWKGTPFPFTVRGIRKLTISTHQRQQHHQHRKHRQHRQRSCPIPSTQPSQRTGFAWSGLSAATASPTSRWTATSSTATQ